MIWIIQSRPSHSNSNSYSGAWTQHALILLVLTQVGPYCGKATAFHIFRHSQNSNNLPFKIIYANGMTEESLPECGPMAVCNKVDTYDKPWIEKQCKCPGNASPCSTSLSSNDGHTLVDKTRQYKMCESVGKLGKCRYFRDVTWTLVTKGDNLTEQIVHCACPKDSVAYMIKRQAFQTEGEDSIGFKYSFACSPQSRVLCGRKEPCRLFTVKRRTAVTEVNTSTLCLCPRGLHCPSHHTGSGAIPGKFYPENQLRTYSGYCV